MSLVRLLARSSAVTVAALAVLLAAPTLAHSSTLIGANMGVSILSSEGETQTVIGIPHSGDIYFGGMRPGLRISGIGASGGPEVYLDAGVTMFSYEGDSYHSMVGTLNYQHNLSPANSTSPFVTLGAGIGHIGIFAGSGETIFLVGAGVGVRHWLAHRHGATRIELRYDRMEQSEGDTPGVNVLAFKFGFDLVLNGGE